MLRVFLIITFIFVSAGSLLAQPGAEVSLTFQYFAKKEDDRYTLQNPQFYLQGWAGDKAGMWFFVYGEPGPGKKSEYFSMALGPYFGIGNFMEAGVGVGVETFDKGGDNWIHLGRYVGQLRLGTLETDDIFIETYYENGPSKSPWMQSNLSIRLLDKPASWIGFMQQTALGTGFRVKMDLGFVPLKLWVVPKMKGKNGASTVLGGEIYFSH